MYCKRAVKTLDSSNPLNFRLPCCTSKLTEDGYGWVKSHWSLYFPTNQDGSKNFNMTRKELMDETEENFRACSNDDISDHELRKKLVVVFLIFPGLLQSTSRMVLMGAHVSSPRLSIQRQVQGNVKLSSSPLLN